MTATTDTDGHPEVAEISALADGLVQPSRAAELREHLAGCLLCEDVRSSLEEIRSLLGTLPGPARMPEDIAGRIDAALAAEALLDATSPESTGATTVVVAPDKRTAPMDGRPTVADRAAGKDAINSGHAAAASGDPVSRETCSTAVSRETRPVRSSGGATDRPASYPRFATGPGRKPLGPRTARARRWPKVLLGTATAAAVIGIGGLLLQNGSSQGEADNPGVSAAQKTPGNSDGVSSATLGDQVHDLLAAPGRNKSPDVGTQSSPQTPLRGEENIVPSCVRRGIGRAEVPLVTTRDIYEGEDAYIVVLPHPSDPKSVSAYVVSASCVSASPSPPGKILLKGTYPRD